MYFSSIPQIPMPMPTGGIHLAVSRPRLGQMNDSSRNEKLSRAFKKVVLNFVEQNHRLPNCLCLSEQSLLPLMSAAQLSLIEKSLYNIDHGTAKVYALERNSQMKNVLKAYTDQNPELIKDRIVFLDNVDISSLEPEQIPDKVSRCFLYFLFLHYTFILQTSSYNDYTLVIRGFIDFIQDNLWGIKIAEHAYVTS
jgi:hypothetical protein